MGKRWPKLNPGMPREIRPIYLPIPKLVGTAITVRAQPGDSLAKALAIAQPGNVIVIDGRGVVKRSPWGGERSQFAASRGIGGRDHRWHDAGYR
jgi:regulator of RNase E activity RraA